MILAAACAAASGSIFADSTEQRILLLENELQRLKTELKEQNSNKMFCKHSSRKIAL